MKDRIKTKMIKILSGNKEINLTVRVADTQRKKEKGLAFVRKLPENEGMLFVFSEKACRSFWTKNTFIPLSIAFIDSDGEILKILDMEPCKEGKWSTYNPGIAYQYAIEVNLRWFEKNQIKEGAYVKFE